MTSTSTALVLPMPPAGAQVPDLDPVVAPPPEAGAGSSPLGLCPSAPQDVSVWGQRRPPIETVILVEDGQSLCTGGDAGVLVTLGGGRFPLHRIPPVDVTLLAELLIAPEYQEAFFRGARLVCPRGSVPGHVAWWADILVSGRDYESSEHRDLRPTNDSDCCCDYDPGTIQHRPDAWEYVEEDGQEGARHLLARALIREGLRLKEKSRRTCGERTLEHRWQDATGNHRSWCRLTCRSQRCPACATDLGRKEGDRIYGQILRDVKCGRAPLVMMTITADRSRYASSVELMRDLVERVAVVVQRLRRHYGDDLAYVLSVEFHEDGWPHVHLLIRCADLNQAMLDDSGERSWTDLVARVAKESDPGAEWHGCPFRRLRRRLNSWVVDAGLGRTGFYVAPVVSSESALTYVTKSQDGSKSKRGVTSPISAEITKTTQITGVFPPHFRRFRHSGKAGDGRLSSFFVDEPARGKPERQTIDLAILRARPEVVRDAYVEMGVEVCGEVLTIDRTTPRDERGLHPVVLGGFAAAEPHGKPQRRHADRSRCPAKGPDLRVAVHTSDADDGYDWGLPLTSDGCPVLGPGDAEGSDELRGDRDGDEDGGRRGAVHEYGDPPT